MTLDGVRDLAGNVMKKPLKWSFVMQDFGAKEATVTISGMKLNIPYTQATDGSVAESLRESLASSLGVPESQLTNFVPSPAEDGTTLFSFDILPPDAETAARAGALTASEIAGMLGAIDPSQNTFLNQFLSPNSTVGVVMYLAFSSHALQLSQDVSSPMIAESVASGGSSGSASASSGLMCL
jgi:hypothetical protein